MTSSRCSLFQNEFHQGLFFITTAKRWLFYTKSEVLNLDWRPISIHQTSLLSNIHLLTVVPHDNIRWSFSSLYSAELIVIVLPLASSNRSIVRMSIIMTSPTVNTRERMAITKIPIQIPGVKYCSVSAASPKRRPSLSGRKGCTCGIFFFFF